MALYRNRERSVPDLRAGRHGDAAFADFILAGVSRLSRINAVEMNWSGQVGWFGHDSGGGAEPGPERFRRARLVALALEAVGAIVSLRQDQCAA